MHENLQAVFGAADFLDDAARADGKKVVSARLFDSRILLGEQNNRLIFTRHARFDRGN